MASQEAAAKREKSASSSDLSGLVQRMRMKQVMSGTMKPKDYYDLVSSKVTLDDVMQQKHLLYLETIPQSSVAVYQTVNNGPALALGEAQVGVQAALSTGDAEALLKAEPMKREVDEVTKLETKTDIVLGPDGKALKLAEFRDHVTADQFELTGIEELLLLCHYNEAEETTTTTSSLDTPHECAICEARFDTEKTLILHIQLKHVSSTKVYQCPSCSETFLRAHLVIAHLSNDHKKSLKKIRSMRDTIHKRHMRIDEVQVKGPSRELHRLQTEKERVEAENKAYLDNMANFDNSNQSMCTYCNKIFERKAVLTSHMVNCRLKFEKMLMGASGSAPAATTAITQSSSNTSSSGSSGAGASGAKRGPKPKENGSTKEKKEEMGIQQQDENSSSSTVISSDGGSNEGSTAVVVAEQQHQQPTTGENSNEGATVVVVKRKRKTVPGKSSQQQQQAKKGRKEEQQQQIQQEQQHSKVSELLEKEIWNTALLGHEDRDDSYFSFDDKAPEDARDESYKRRYPCEICNCNKSFSTMSNLKRHNVMFHYFQHRYSCRVCNYQGMKKKVALAHLRDVHKVDKEEHEMKAMLIQEKSEVIVNY